MKLKIRNYISLADFGLQVKTLYNTTNSERTLKELKVKKLKLKDAINKLQGESNGKED